MSNAQQLPLLLAQPHRNHTLFSDHYLEEILRREPLWPAARPRAAALLAFLRDLYAREAAQLSGYSEAQLEDHWIKPLLAHLGHVWETQATVPGLAQGIKKPDYVFFADETARQTAVADQRTGEYARHALAVGEVKAWPVNLSRRTANAPTFDNSNPMFQIDAYLRSTGVRWGIVSNGRHWRLVQRDSSHKLDVYFELDLLDALNAADETHALAVATYFVLFFGQPAFRPDEGALFLDRVLRGSRDYAVALENDLRDNAYKALEQLITGFFAPPKNQLDANDPAHRDAVYRHSLLLLYRLLFLFYGESRGLLPLRNPAYAERSLSALARGAALRVDNHTVDALPATAGGLWGQLDELFTVINGDDPDLNAALGVPRYNGGLFDPQRHPFLARHFVGQRHLVRALDYLARRRKTDNGRDLGYEAVDYRTLGIRQLGSIYEGLLEYKVSLAAEPMVTVRKGGKETWLPARERGKAKSIETRQPGQLYLATDKGERKATGSYYTPDAIVKYIVEQTLGPLVEEARKRATSDERRVTSEEAAGRFAAEVLALNVLDPAMGSGHFLVEATNFLARALVEGAGGGRPLTDDGRPPTGDESDLTYWRRRVVEACIYGVDKNELAVELAKLSLWLETAAADKPLSFLDHHLRHGDSLIGAWLRDLDAPPRPVRSRRPDRSVETDPLFDEPAFTLNAGQAVGGAAAIEALLTEDLEAVHAKERLFRDFHDNTLGRWRRLADLWVSAYFGNTMSAAEYADLARRIQGRPATLSDAQAARYLEHPAVVANDYFHWELEFPEVFFDGYGRPKGAGAGFDAVIGNPPYVRQEQLKEAKPYYIDHYADVYFGTADLFVYFFRQAVALLRLDGLTSYISSSSWLRANYASGLRRFLRGNTTIELLLDLGDNKVFVDAPDLYPAIHVVRKREPSLESRTKTAVFQKGAMLDDFENQLSARLFPLSILDQSDEAWQLDVDENRQLFEKLSKTDTTLGSSEGQLYIGIKTALNDVFVISSTLVKAHFSAAYYSEFIKPILAGADLRPWYQAYRDEYVIAIPTGWTSAKYASGKTLDEQEAWSLLSQDYPELTAYLAPHAEKGRKRQDKGDYWWELRPCAYYDAFTKPKIMWPDITKFPRFSWDETGTYLGNTGYILVTQDKWLLAYLNSRCAWYLISKMAIALGERAGLQRYRLIDQYMRPLPVPNAPAAEQASLGALADGLTAAANARFQLHQATRHRVNSDLGSSGLRLNEKLTNWWELDFPGFRREVKLALKCEIPVRERADWEHYLAEARNTHEAYTADIVRMETELNAIVYRLFDLTTAEVQIIEDSTKYRYGEI